MADPYPVLPLPSTPSTIKFIMKSQFSEFSDCAFVSVYPHRKYYLENTDLLLIVRTRWYRRYHLVFPGPLRAPGFVMIGLPPPGWAHWAQCLCGFGRLTPNY